MKIRQCVSRFEITEDLRRGLITCWAEVTNAGGAAGLAFPPVTEDDVGPAVDELIRSLNLDECRLLIAVAESEPTGWEVVGWCVLRRSSDPLIAHWGSLHHVQSLPDRRGEGIGSGLVNRAREVARDELGLEQLRVSVRAGMGLEDFYRPLGWREAGRWPSALRLGEDDVRDEILMHLDPL